MTDKKPFEIARETLKLLTARKLVPTPGNYQMVYSEVAGIPPMQAFPADPLRDIAQALPAKTPGQQKQKALLEYAIDRLNWDGVKNALVAYGGFSPITAPSDAASLAPPPALAKVETEKAPALTSDFMGQVGRLIEYVQPALGEEDSHFVEQTQSLVRILRDPSADTVVQKAMLMQYGHRLSFVAEDQAEIKATLLRLLQMIFGNIADLSLEEQWLKGQMEALQTASEPPISLRRLDELEVRLKDVIFKQKEAKLRWLSAQEEMKQMLATFVDRLSEMSHSTGTFQGKLEESARLIEQARSLDEVAPVLKAMVSATREMAEESSTAREELKRMKERSETTEAEIAKLHQELDRVSTQARHDPLTGALNRKGLEEAIDRELARVKRKETPLCMSLLDIDNFKRINDSLGHAMGDQALVHLAKVARESMRPQDTLARYGGEEFVILLPDTPLDRGIDAMTRLQRELTKRFFLAGTEKLLITFSAGVAQLEEGESGMDAIKRADKAMYLAKRAGKNRVIGA